MRWIHKLIVLMLLGLASSMVAAQGSECPAFVQEAIAAMDANCAATARNQACYGNGAINAISVEGGTIGDFVVPGDLAEIAEIDSMTLAGLDETQGLWGISLMQVQANLPDTLPGQNVTILLFGDVEINNAGDAMEAFTFRSGIGAPDCSEAPNGILVQTPEGQGQIALTMNGVNIELGSTAYITADVNEDFTFALLEGKASVNVVDKTVEVEAGQFTTVAMSDDLAAPLDVPLEPQDIEDNLELPTLPLAALPRDITEDDSDDASTASNTSSTAADGEIILLSGSWRYTSGAFETSAACPAMMADAISQNAPIVVTETIEFGGEVFDLQSFFAGNLDEALPGGEFSQPEPNVHQWTYVEEGVSFVYEFRIIAEDRIEGSFTFDMGATGFDCIINLPFEVDYAG